MKTLIPFIRLAMLTTSVSAQQPRPVIDMHLHASPADNHSAVDVDYEYALGNGRIIRRTSGYIAPRASVADP